MQSNDPDITPSLKRVWRFITTRRRAKPSGVLASVPIATGVAEAGSTIKLRARVEGLEADHNHLLNEVHRVEDLLTDLRRQVSGMMPAVLAKEWQVVSADTRINEIAGRMDRVGKAFAGK